jgi:trehalose 6-phosphate synthase
MRLMVSLPNHQELVESLFAYDVVGFHTQDWLESFIDYARAQMDATVGEDGTITWNGRTIRAVVCPIGIDAREFAETANGPAAETMRQRMVESAGGRAMIVGGSPRLFQGIAGTLHRL